MVGIYKIISPSSKIYIGQSINIGSRKNQYKYNNCKSQPRLFNSLNKYGFENHIFEIIEECTLELLDEREKYWKEEFIKDKGWINMLFCSLYDSGGGPKSEETKAKISVKLKNNKDRGPKISKSLLGKPSPLKGREISQEHKDKIKATRGYLKGRILNYNKPINQYNLNQTFIKEWSSQKEASLSLNKIGDGIGACCRGKQKSAYNFIWKFKNKEKI